MHNIVVAFNYFSILDLFNSLINDCNSIPTFKLDGDDL